MPSVDSKAAKFRQLQDEAAQLLDKAQHGPILRRALYVRRATELVREMNKIDSDNSESPSLRTREQFFKDVAAGRLR